MHDVDQKSSIDSGPSSLLRINSQCALRRTQASFSGLTIELRLPHLKAKPGEVLTGIFLEGTKPALLRSNTSFHYVLELLGAFCEAQHESNWA